MILDVLRPAAAGTSGGTRSRVIIEIGTVRLDRAMHLIARLRPGCVPSYLHVSHPCRSLSSIIRGIGYFLAIFIASESRATACRETSSMVEIGPKRDLV
jgi:hypothetical protein